MTQSLFTQALNSRFSGANKLRLNWLHEAGTAILFSLMTPWPTRRKAGLIASAYQPAYKPGRSESFLREMSEMWANNLPEMNPRLGSEVKCGATGFPNTARRLQVSVNSGEVNFRKHSHPVIRLGLNKELPASTKGADISPFLKKEARSPLWHVSLSLLCRPPPRLSFLPLLSFVGAVNRRLGLKLKTP